MSCSGAHINAFDQKNGNTFKFPSKSMPEKIKKTLCQSRQVGKNPRGLVGAVGWPDLMERGPTQDGETVPDLLSPLVCVCSNRGWSACVLLLGHSPGSTLPLWLLSSCCPFCLHSLSLQPN